MDRSADLGHDMDLLWNNGVWGYRWAEFVFLVMRQGAAEATKLAQYMKPTSP